MRILVVEDEPTLQAQLVQAIAGAGHTVEAAADGREAQYLGEVEDFDAVVLDLGLPLLDGLSVLRHWRAAGRRMPVLILTARSSWQEKVAGMDAGADDYLAKPFHMEELLARLRALLRRPAQQEAPVLQHGELSIDAHARTVRWRGQDVALTPKEYALLELLLRRQGATLSRVQIFEHLYDSRSDASDKVVEVIMSTLRTKLAPLGLGDLIVTRRGFGYSIP